MFMLRDIKAVCVQKSICIKLLILCVSVCLYVCVAIDKDYGQAKVKIMVSRLLAKTTMVSFKAIYQNEL